ncbi:SPX domain-containing protein 4 [Arabidopsis thaliana]|uniref:SPX domain-containing protein 4 n=6 Tax=Arabidopsis TaxID=3701 RepID=SPX4_ARATH|nr:SPX domain-containing protein 4 [Arabidopsis thaliana]Q94A21.1 RecName: Full=SPX domain-containing protein 4; AltName: Full=Protein SPX DOMAIN GENE 4; Short=AtSPX4 [Arabidopsis thaliana]KAG7602332.1 SPX domain [Arabidopsis thaliana x Arabidopsis arenosa]KAG7609278.1 SPX domain [Arabidopsis suecica]AAK91456.1 AT5g15330/F8M21_220 [Arabidopsis thaliana]AAV97799.1 At5g15330 [Arabidopsis thaliana]AED92150.1 SPX domain-containing protein 4 [Arabidopsis thaliana]|eukprot:NP_568312.1 SPX domain-containing protein 4 [Arabidopsis thaliana]
MKFGKEFRTHLEETLPEWRDKFLCYKPLKKLLKYYPYYSADFGPANSDHNDSRPVFADTTNISSAADDGGVVPGVRPSEDLQGSFVRILNDELEKFNDFYVDKEEDFVIRLQELKERIEQVKEKNGEFASESEFSEEMMDIRRDLVTIHGEMVLLKNYSSLNFAGLVKILKKYDKRTGGLLRLPFTQLVLHQPFFTTEPLTRLVRECEANLELLFPSEAEVVESSSAVQAHSSSHQHNSPRISAETSSTLGNENLDIYKSTLAAMRAIRGLQKASSTYNPLSFSSLLQNEDDETVTAENSPNSGNKDDSEKEDTGPSH